MINVVNSKYGTFLAQLVRCLVVLYLREVGYELYHKKIQFCFKGWDSCSRIGEQMKGINCTYPQWQENIG